MNATESIDGAGRESCLLAALLGAIALCLVAFVYWPVHRGEFVWDDIVNFQLNDWLTAGDKWKHYVLRDFNHWTNYFRPLGVALFTVQVRLFDTQPGPMHVVSLALHLVDCLLVGLLARLCSRAAGHAPRVQALWFAFAILLYGLHPALIEVVAWIGCQFDLVATLFMLLGALASGSLRKVPLRATAVAGCFFVAACAKESAVVYPAMLLVFDWALQARLKPGMGPREFLRDFAHRNAPVVVAMLVAGLAYLVFRRCSLGYLTHSAPLYGGVLSPFGSLQRAGYTIMQYWRMLLWPTHDLNPIHDFDFGLFEKPSLSMMACVALAICIPLAAVHGALRRRSALACIALLVTIGILPVANLLQTGFTVSLYQERYVINALAFSCAMLPLLKLPVAMPAVQLPWRPILALLLLVWFATSVMAIHTTLPLWRTNMGVWRWAYAQNKNAKTVQYNLTSAYVGSDMFDEANALIDEIVGNGHDCPDCAVLVAEVSIKQGDLARAEYLLQLVRNSPKTATDHDLLSTYLLAQGELAKQRGEYRDAETLLENHLRLTPDKADGFIDLAETLQHLGQNARARETADKAMQLTAPDKRGELAAWHRQFTDAATP